MIEGKNQLSGYLKAMADIVTRGSLPIVHNYDCIDIKNHGNINSSIVGYLANNWYDFGLSPDVWSRYPGESFKKVIEEKQFKFEKVLDWKDELSKTLDRWFPKVMMRDIFKRTNNTIEINDLSGMFIYMLEDEFETTALTSVLRFCKEDFDFLSHCFTCLLYDTYIFVTDEKVYVMFFGQSD